MNVGGSAPGITGKFPVLRLLFRRDSDRNGDIVDGGDMKRNIQHLGRATLLLWLGCCLAACNSQVGSSGTLITNLQPGGSCNSQTDYAACSGTARLRCDANTATWQLLDTCPPAASCFTTYRAGGLPGLEAVCSATSAGGQDAGVAVDGGGTGLPVDAGNVGGSLDAGSPVGSKDAGSVDAGKTDTGKVDPPPVDAGAVDAGLPDSSPYTIKGGFQGFIDGKVHFVDYGNPALNKNMLVTVGQVHRQTAEATTCVPQLALSMARADGSCKLQLIYEADETGQLRLTTATFDARALNYGDNGYAPGQYPCVGWANEPASGGVTYQMSSGNGSMWTGGPLGQPWASQSQAKIPSVKLMPAGTLQMKAGNRSFELVFNGLEISGPVSSKGDPNVACKKEAWNPLPNVTLKDINPKSPTAGQMVNMNDFKGKRVAVLMGAGWCASCIAQVEYMQTVKEQFEAQGKNDFVMVAINASSAKSASHQAAITGKKKKATFPVLQATSTANGWAAFGGKKNDCFIHFSNGKLAFKHIGKATVNLTQFKAELIQGLSAN